jgi:peptidyl-prolyl cis-trans isomerase SurA
LLYKKNKNIEKEIINSLKSNNLNAIKNIAKKHKDTMRYIKYNAIKMAQIPSSLVTYLPKHSGKINTFRNENGVNFIKLKSKSLKDLSKPIYQYKIQHILLVAPSDADKKIRKNEIYKIYNSLLKSKDKYSQFNALALLKNEDSNTKNNNGEMDWRAIKELSPSIAKYIVKARKNQISKPIKTIQGWHIVRLLDTRKKSFGMKEYRKAIKRFLFQEQMPMVVSNWLKTTRINAYIRKIDKNGNEKKITNPSQ